MVPEESPLDLASQTLPEDVLEVLGEYEQSARLLGTRTAELHNVLASGLELPDFAPEPFTSLYQRSVYQSMRNLTGEVFRLLHKRLDALPTEVRSEAATVLELKDKVLQLFESIHKTKITSSRIRCHGDYHLGQVLYTGDDFVIIDFEGEPARSIGERRLKRSPLRDVAGMLRSFHYAVFASLFSHDHQGALSQETLQHIDSVIQFWHRWVCAVFLRAYLETAGSSSFIPPNKGELRIMLEAFVLEKAVYELGYELNNRPGWVKIPLQGISQLCREAD